MREAKASRTTKETKISISLNLDGTGKSEISTGVGFFDHMLTLFAFHSKIDLQVEAQGDLEVCDHHLIEDTGILLGKCIKQALGDKKGIERYGSSRVPMDETLTAVDLDFSGRFTLIYHVECKRESIGNYSVEMTPEFLKALADNAGLCLHVNTFYGENDHHKIESIFKALGRAMRQAIEITSDEVVSTKGVLE